MSHPPPTYQSKLILANLHLLHSGSSRECLLTTAHATSALTSPSGIANAVFNGWVNLAAQLDNSVQMTYCDIRLGDGSSTPFVGVSTSTPVNGGAASNSMPPNNNLLVKKGSGLGGRQNRGRTYVPWCVDEVNVDELGIVNPASVAGIQPLFDAVRAAWATADVELIIGHKTITTPLPPAKPYVSAYTQGPAVVSWRVEGLIASQRRRIGR